MLYLDLSNFQELCASDWNLCKSINSNIMIGVNECFNLLTLSNLGKLVRKLRLVYSPPHQKITRLNPFFVKFHGVIRNFQLFWVVFLWLYEAAILLYLFYDVNSYYVSSHQDLWAPWYRTLHLFSATSSRRRAWRGSLSVAWITMLAFQLCPSSYSHRSLSLWKDPKCGLLVGKRLLQMLAPMFSGKN